MAVMQSLYSVSCLIVTNKHSLYLEQCMELVNNYTYKLSMKCYSYVNNHEHKCDIVPYLEAVRGKF
jgi:hypothetical protein